MDYSKIKLLLLLPSLFILSVIHIKNILRFWKLNKKHQGLNKLKHTFSNLHILFHPVDCLHFEFAVLAVDREVTAKAIQANMSLSFRGYDISLVPLRQPKIYDEVWKHVDRVHSISKDLVTRAIQLGLSPNQEIHYITPAIAIEKFEATTSVNWNEKPYQFCTTGRISWKKGYQYVFESLFILKNKGIPFIYHIVGGFEPEEEERFKYLVLYFGLQNHIIFHGKLKPEEINTLLNTVHIYIQYSVQEGFCNAALEAQSKGLMVIVSDAGGLKENVIDWQTGWVVQSANPILLAKKIEEVLDLPLNEKMKISDQAHHRIIKNFNIQKQNELFKEFFNY